MEAVTLKNGTEEADVMVTAMMMVLHDLLREQPIVFYELVMQCRNKKHQFWGNTGQVIKDRALLGADGEIHDSVCNIVLSAVTGEGLSMILGSPVKEG